MRVLRGVVSLSSAMGAAVLASGTPAIAQTPIEVTPPAAQVSASTADAGNVAGNTVDGKPETRWSGSGNGAWIQFDLGATWMVSHVRIAVYKGNERRNKFDLEVSTGGGVWTKVLTNALTPNAVGEQTHDFPDTPARLVRYVGQGAVLNAGGTSPWNSLTEVSIFAMPAASPSPSPSPDPSPSPSPDPSPGPSPNPASCRALLDNGGPASQWAFFGAADTIAYKNLDARGDHILDFSHAGYGGGGVALPSVPVVETLSPSGADDTAAIQAAINRVSARAPAGGFRGAVLLSPGSYRVSGTLRINASGVVLRGSGSAANGTVVAVGGTPFRFMEIKGSGAATIGNEVSITDAYVPAGSFSVNVDSTAGFNVGDTVYVRRPVTEEWVRFMGMDTLVRDGRPQTWLAAGTIITTDRVITGISGHRITLDAPITDSIDAGLLDPPGARLARYAWPGRISQVGVEGLRIEAPRQGSSLSGPQFGFLTVDAVVDGWVRDVYMKDCVNCMSLSKGSKRVTVQDVTFQHTGAVSSAPYPADYSVNGTQLLLNRCAALDARNVYTIVTQSIGTGPNVVLNYRSTRQKGVEPHQRWATGLLLDNIDVDGSIGLLNRGIFGSGHGWTIGWGVVWNSRGGSLTIQRPPGSMNWAIGAKGTIDDQSMPGGDGSDMPRGIFESQGTFVTPRSLYLAQLCSRLGPQALANLGY